jgi:uncharacterized membrane protein
MNYIKYTQYVYLIFGLFFIYDGINKMINKEPYIFSFVIAVAAVFMFFFRRNFAKRVEERNKKQ